MQQATRMRAPRGYTQHTITGAVLVLVATFAAVVTVWWMTRTAATVPQVAALATRGAVGRVFADEMGYVPTISEYTTGALGDDYLPLAVLAAAPAGTARVALSRVFADEMGYMPAISEYTAGTLGDDYLQAVVPAPRTSVVQYSRSFRDELAGSALLESVRVALPTADEPIERPSRPR